MSENLIEVPVPEPEYPPLPPLPRFIAVYCLYNKTMGGVTWNIAGPDHSERGALEDVNCQGHQYEVIRSTIRVFQIPEKDAK